jgi:hypothetical protein
MCNKAILNIYIEYNEEGRIFRNKYLFLTKCSLYMFKLKVGNQFNSTYFITTNLIVFIFKLLSLN